MPYSSPLVSFKGKVIIPKGQIASAEWFGDDGGRLYSGGCIFSLHSNYCQNLASYFRSSFIHSASEDQVSIRRTNRGDIGRSNHGKAMVDAYSPYTAIIARPWLHTLGVVSSTLHQKIKYPSGGQIEEILGDQTMARQCMVAAIRHRPEAEPVTLEEREL